MQNFLLIPLLVLSLFMNAEYKNTNGVASDKTFSDMLKWIRSDVEPKISYIDISTEWKNLDLKNDDNYANFIVRHQVLMRAHSHALTA